jgi:hypothetical protein
MPAMAANNKWDLPPSVLRLDGSLITANKNSSQLVTRAINGKPTMAATNFVI